MLLFCTATAAEWRAACPAFTAELPEQTLLPWHAPNGQEHKLCITGVGPVNAALSLGMALGQSLSPNSSMTLAQGITFDAVINLGVAGSFDLNRAPLGSVWRVQREIWPEYGLCDGTEVAANAAALGFSQWQDSHGKEIWQELDLPEEIPHFPNLDALGLPTAVSLSVAGVTNSLDRAARLCAKYGALLENMEGFALALGCARRAVPLLEMRTVSNMVGSRAPEHRDFPRALDALRPALHKLLESAHA